jgi:hypothetical protein
MAAVAFAACNFAAIRPTFDPQQNPVDRTSRLLLIFGALPVANILVVGLVVGYRRPASQPFLFGFEALGWMVLTVFVSSAISDPRWIMEYYLAPILRPLEEATRGMHPFVIFPAACCVLMAVLALPQIAFATVGGLLSRTYGDGRAANGEQSPADA